VSERVAWYLGTEHRPGAADPAPEPAPDSAVVPDAAERGRVVLAGHSQGSVIALAAAVIQPPAARRRLSLITVGCVLDRLYSRFFPRYFGPELYRLAAQMLSPDAGAGTAAPADAGRWTNIWRHSDYLGGAVPYPPVLARIGPQDVQSIDPRFAVPPGDTVYPAARRHSDFWTDPAYLPQVERLLGEAEAAAVGGLPSRRTDEGHPPADTTHSPAAASHSPAAASHSPAAASHPSADAAARPDPLSPSAGR
jgi:hypothetical protein